MALNTYKEYSEAFSIFAKYSDGKLDMVCAQHDVIYAGPEVPDKILPEDENRLKELGWRRSSEGGFEKFV